MSVKATSPTCSVEPKLASTIGLIANEFAANTVKHGDISKGNPEINYTLSVKGTELTLTCKNNVAEQMRVESSSGDSKPSPGIGARLIKASVAQFGGHIQQTGSAKGFELIATLFLP